MLQIRTGPVGSLSIEELIIGQAYLDVIIERVHENGHDVPENLKQEQTAVGRELDSRLVEDRQRKRAVLLSRKEALLTNVEKRNKIDQELAELDKQLGLKPSAKKATR